MNVILTNQYIEQENDRPLSATIATHASPYLFSLGLEQVTDLAGTQCLYGSMGPSYALTLANYFIWRFGGIAKLR